MNLPILRPDWPAPANVRAAVSTRLGGVSTGPYASLNLGNGAGDDPIAVGENRRRLSLALDLPVEPSWLRQVHGTRVLDLNAGAARPEADASFTTRTDCISVVQAADCLPVLFCNDAGTVVAAAHAGWRGLAAGVLEATVRALPVAPDSLMAWMGPAIGPDAFEVGPDVRDAFAEFDQASGMYFRPQGGDKYLADLFGLARRRLERAGVSRVHGGGRCTFSEPENFFSFRRDGRCGRMAALIWIAAVPQKSRGSE